MHDSSSWIHWELEVTSGLDRAVSELAGNLGETNGLFRIAEDSLTVVDHGLIGVVSPGDAQVLGPGGYFVDHGLSLTLENVLIGAYGKSMALKFVGLILHLLVDFERLVEVDVGRVHDHLPG